MDSDNSGDKVTRLSKTGILLYFNSVPIIFYYRRKDTVVRSNFGLEFMALRIVSDMIISMQYKLHIFGITIDGPDNVFCDNETVYKNYTFVKITIKEDT